MNLGSDERLNQESGDIARTNFNAGETMVSSEADQGSSFSFSAPVEEDHDVPEEFGRYQVLREIGRGAMGCVYLAHDTQLDRDVAIKIPKFNENAESSVVERFYREARAMAMLRHANLCPVYDVGEIDGVHYLTMAYIDGDTLSRYIEPDKMTPNRQAAEIIRKIALALQEAHLAKLVHRDLKPANIMIDNRNEPIIMDFGLARREESETRLTQTGALLGTPAYMSPEQIDEETEPGPSCDIYAIGVILYEMLTGKLPFEGNAASTLIKIVTAEPKPPTEIQPEVDKALEAICLKAMSKKPSDRYLTAQDMAEALNRYLHGTNSAAPEVEFNLVPGDGVQDTGSKYGSQFQSYDTDDMIAGFYDEEEQGEQQKKKPETDSKAGSKISADKVEVACKCGSKFAAKRELIGKTLKCPKCGASLQVGGGQAKPRTPALAKQSAQLTVSCQCGAKFAAKPELAGKTVRCAKCSKPLKVPMPRQSAPVASKVSTQVSCAECGSRFAAKKDMAGKTFRCRKCGSTVKVPG